LVERELPKLEVAGSRPVRRLGSGARGPRLLPPNGRTRRPWTPADIARWPALVYCCHVV